MVKFNNNASGISNEFSLFLIIISLKLTILNFDKTFNSQKFSLISIIFNKVVEMIPISSVSSKTLTSKLF